MLIYLAHPIDQAQQRHTRSILVQVVAHILEAGRQQGHGFYRPGGAFNLPAPPWDDDLVRAVDLINQQAIFECHGVLAVVAPGIPTLGTVSEIETALLLNRPTCIVTTEELVSIQQKHLGISFGYGCKTIRVRTMVGRTWTDRVDFQIKEGWGAELYAFLDRHFGPPQPTPESIRKPYPYHNFSS